MDPLIVVALIGAFATIASAAVIAWQAIETKKSAAATARAADAAENALQVANASLSLSQEQAQLSRQVADEAIRMRLDARSASVTLTFLEQDADGPVHACFAISDIHDAETLQAIDPGHRLQNPQDAEKWFWVVFHVAFKNMGASPLTVDCSTFYSAFNLDTTVAGRTPKIDVPTLERAPDGVTGYLAAGGWGSQWFRTANLPEKTHTISGEAGWSTELAGETGNMETQEIKVMGTFLGPGQRPSEWEVRGFGPDINYPSRLEARKQKRLYFLPGGQLLPDQPSLEGPA
ncbi:hypothetical protein [Arthrobacter sp. UYCu511]|uniref:hypothetical protein n=1 Tax=Arthrobacter sp. UYCu511 TaxID=3156337 RepID=UPI0033946784